MESMETDPIGGEVDEEIRADEACPVCGVTRADLYLNGRMGCASCYETFTNEVLRALWRVHGAVEHIGKS